MGLDVVLLAYVEISNTEGGRDFAGDALTLTGSSQETRIELAKIYWYLRYKNAFKVLKSCS
jgi:hypothetical protein